MLGNSDIIMRHEQYQDLLREAAQERLIQVNRRPWPGLRWLRSSLAGILHVKSSRDHRLSGWKGAHL
jgi:hypothetical protein